MLIESDPIKPPGFNVPGRFLGWVVDSITVSGNRKTKDFVLLREMETRPGAALDEVVLERDHRYLNDLGLFASIEFEADSLAPKHCALRIEVKERSTVFIKTIIPIVNYDFDKGFTFGVKWDFRNFRGRGEVLGGSVKRDADKNDDFSLTWNAPWLGWRHITLRSEIHYYRRDQLETGLAVNDRQAFGMRVGVPLTSSRISFSQLLGQLAIENRRTGSVSVEEFEQTYLIPLIGVLWDNRDSPLRPTRGVYLHLATSAWHALSGLDQTYYRLWNDLRVFATFSKRATIAFQSNLIYQFGAFPEYMVLGLGGMDTLRGYPSGKFTGWHRWYQSMEYRYELVPKEVFQLPRLGYVDISVALVGFIDTGIVWTGEATFNSQNFRGGAGLGLRLYSPFQDVVRFDLGFNNSGEIYPYAGMGIRF